MVMYGFSVVVDGLDLEDEFQSASLECLPYDVLVSSSAGRVSVDVELDSASATDAVLRVYGDLKSVNATVHRIDLDLVNLADIAERLDTNRETVRLWSTGARRRGFPEHFTSVGDSRVWAWADVYEWLAANSIPLDELYAWTPLPLRTVEAFNGAFAQNRERTREGWMILTGWETTHVASRSQVVSKTGWLAAV